MRNTPSSEFVKFFVGLRRRKKALPDLHHKWTEQIETEMRAAGSWPSVHIALTCPRVVAEYLSRLQACYWDTIKHFCVKPRKVDPERRIDTFPALQTFRLLHTRFTRFGLSCGLFYAWPWNGYYTPTITAVDFSHQPALINVTPFPEITFEPIPYTKRSELFRTLVA